jgi:CheY-like chemotaxis protein
MPAPPVEPTSDDTASVTILVVEPDILVRMVIADYLRDCGYKVVEGVNADEALAVLEAGKKIYVILAEVRLAGSVDGFGLARQIRENHPEIDVILTSGFPVAHVRVQDPKNYRFSASRALGVGSANKITLRATESVRFGCHSAQTLARLSCLRSQNRTARSLIPSAAARSFCVMPARARVARSCRPVQRLTQRWIIGNSPPSTFKDSTKGVISGGSLLQIIPLNL